MRILLTGGTGFVGSALGSRLVAAGHELFCVCRPESSVAFGSKVVWNGRGPIEYSKLPDHVDAVIHLAQSRNYRHFPADSSEMFAINVAMTMFLLEWAAKSKVKQFCLVSSGSVYESFAGSPKEDAALAPSGFLGASKLASEVIAKPFSGIFALNILRLFFPYGPGQRNRLVPELIRRVRVGAAIHLAENGEGGHLTPTFIDDIVEVILASVKHGWTETLNVATPEVLTIRRIADMIGRELGVEPKFENVDTSPLNIIPDLGRLTRRFQLDRFTPFEDGLRKTIGEDLRQRAGST